MRNFVDLSLGSKKKRIITLSSSLTVEDTVTIGSNTYDFNSDGCFTEDRPASYEINVVKDVNENDSLLVSDEAAFRIGYYRTENETKRFTKEGIACIVVKDNQPADFTVDGYSFKLRNPENNNINENGYLINIGKSTYSTASNIASVVGMYCPTVTVYSRGNFVIFKTVFENSPLSGNVPNIVGLEVNSGETIGVNTIVRLGKDNNIWAFRCGDTGESGINPTLKEIIYSKGSTNKETLNNLVTSINNYATITNLGFATLVKTVGFEKIYVYFCEMDYEITQSGTIFDIDTTTFVKNDASINSAVQITSGTSIKQIPLYNLYSSFISSSGLISADITAEIAACLYKEDRNSSTNAISNIEIGYNSILINIESDKTLDINNQSQFLYSLYNKEVPSYAIIEKCLEKLASDINNNGIDTDIASIYGDNSIKLVTNSSTISTNSDNITIYIIGENEYPSSKEDPMSLADFNDFLGENTSVEITLLRSNPELSFTTINIPQNINLNIVGEGDVLELEYPLLKAENKIINLKLINFQLDWTNATLDTAVFEFTHCQGGVSLLNNEISFKGNGSLIKEDQCFNFNISNKHSSYLINRSSTNYEVKIFKISRSSSNILSRHNAIESSNDSGFFYYIENTDGVNFDRNSKDIIRKKSGFIYSNIPNTNQYADGLNESYEPLFCGLYAPYQNKVMPWTFNLVCDSKALNFDYDIDAENDIFGRKRGFNKAIGKSILRIRKETFDSSLNDSSCFYLDGKSFYFTKDYKEHSSINNTEELVKAIYEDISYNSNYKIEYKESDYSQGSYKCFDLIVYGDIVSMDFNTALKYLIVSYSKEICGNNENDSNTLRYLNCIDAGSRQKNTYYEHTYYVDTEIDSSTNTNRRKGTEDDMFSCLDVVNICKSAYPRFGNTTFILKSKSEGDNIVPADLSTCFTSNGEQNSEIHSILYGNVTIKSTMMGLRAVPVLKHINPSESSSLFKIGCFGAPNIILENIGAVNYTKLIEVAEVSNNPYLTLGIEFRNCILKNYDGTSLIDFKDSQFKAVESTLIGSDNAEYSIEGTGVLKIEASIYGVGDIPEGTEYNNPIVSYNYQIISNSTTGDIEELPNNCVKGPNCLTNPFNTIDDPSTFDFDINDFKINEEISDNKAINFIPSMYNLILSNPTVMYDIGGRFRYNDISKVSLDVGAIESEQGLVEPESIVYYVSLNNTSEMLYAGKVNYISWEDFKEKIENISSFENIYKVYLSGYGLDKKGIKLESNVAFSEQARIEFYGEKDCVYEGNSFFESNCPFVNMSVSGIVFRTSETFIKLLEESNLWITNCFIISHPLDSENTFYTFDVTPDCSLKLYSCSIQTCENHNVFNAINSNSGFKLAMFGCVVQGIDNESIFGYEGEIITSYQGGVAYHNLTEITSDTQQAESFEYELINPIVITKERLYSSDSELLQDPYSDRFALYYSDISASDGKLKAMFEEGLKYNWITDINDNIRSLNINSKIFETDSEQTDFLERNNLFTSYGCYDSKSKDIENYYDSNPNREITCITEIGRTMITRMLSNTVRFKIEGFAICSDGYNYNNPVLATKIKRDTRTIIRYAVKTALASADEADITVGNIVLHKGSDFDGTSVSQITSSLVSAINKIKVSIGDNLSNSASFSAKLINADDGEFEVERLMPGVNQEEIECSVENGLEKISSIDPEENVQYDKYQVLPKSEFNVFERIEYLPLAISMFYRVEREVWSGGFGSEVVYARIIDSSNEEEKNTIFPLCVCHHGLVTKGHDSFIVGRIILQI